MRYVSTDTPIEDDLDKLWTHFTSITGIEPRLPRVEIVSAHDRSVRTMFGDDDVFLGTAWWTVQMIKHALCGRTPSPFLYLVQEYEPGMYPWSTVHALALETYSLDFRAIVNEAVLLDHFAEQRIGRFADPRFVDDSLVFEPAVDRTRFRPEPDMLGDRPRRLLFYARPSAPRNLYELGLHALRRSVELGAFPAASGSSGLWEKP